MHRLQCCGLPLPEIYVCNSRAEAKTLLDAGIPCVITRIDDIKIVKIILLRTLKKKFPHIKWNEVLKVRETANLNIMVPGSRSRSKQEKIECEEAAESKEDTEKTDEEYEEWKPKGTTDEMREPTDRGGTQIAESERVIQGGGYAPDEVTPEEVPIDEYCLDAAASVNIEQLQALGFLPKFMSDAADAIRINLENRMEWRECFNKKLGECVGDVGYGDIARNLIILDVSYSIPEGISATMLQLIATLREQAEADLIVTGGRSLFFPREEELPDPNWLRGAIPRSNESKQFKAILREHIAGRHYGNVISFGDNDTPFWYEDIEDVMKALGMDGTRIDRVMHYHTWARCRTGYATWCKAISPDCVEEFDTSWCRVMFE